MAKQIYHTQVRANANLAKRAYNCGETNNALGYFAVAQKGFEAVCRQTANKGYSPWNVDSRIRDIKSVDRLMHSLASTAQRIGQNADNLYLARFRLFAEGKQNFDRIPQNRLITIVPQEDAA